MSIVKNFLVTVCMALMILLLSSIILVIFDGLLPRSMYMEFGLFSLILSLACVFLASVISSIAYKTGHHAFHAITVVISFLSGLVSWLFSMSIMAFFTTILIAGFSAFLTFYLRVFISKMLTRSKPLDTGNQKDI